MTMDFSRLHTYSPPQCTPENTGYTYALSSSYSSAALDFEREHNIDPVFDSPRMSRRSLRLQTLSGQYGDSGLFDSSYNHSATYSTGKSSRREARTVRSRKQQQMEQKSHAGATIYTPGAASDASLLSSMLDESCIRESTRVDGFWGLDEDGHVRARSSKAHDYSETPLNGSSISQRKAQATTLANGYICNNCSIHSERREALTACSSSSSSSSSNSHRTAGLVSTIYSRSQSHGTGVLVRCAKWVISPVTYLVTLLVQSTLHFVGSKANNQKGVLTSSSDALVTCGRRAVACVRFLKQSITGRSGLGAELDNGGDVGDGAHASYCGSVNMKHLVMGDQQLKLNGSLCDDCKGKKHMETLTVHTRSSWLQRIMGVLWSTCTYSGYGVLQLQRTVASVVWYFTQKILSVVWLAVISPGKAASGAFWWLGTGWYQLVTLMSLLNVFVLTRCLPKLFRLLLLLLPFFFLFGLWYWGSSSLLNCLPTVNVTQWTATPVAFFTIVKQAMFTPQQQQVNTLPPPAMPVSPEASASLEYLGRLEQKLSQLWSTVESSGQLQEKQHQEVQRLYRSLRKELEQQTDRENLGLWVSGLLDEKLKPLREEMQREAGHREKHEKQHHSHMSHLAKLEELLQVLAAKTKELQHKQDVAASSPASDGVQREAHEVLLTEVQRLETELHRVRQDLQGVMGCQGRCDQLNNLQDTVSAQVRQELRELFYGREQAEQQKEIPEPLLSWLSMQFIRSANLQDTLASLELRLIRNISLQLEQHKPITVQTVSQAVAHTAGDAGMSEEQVHLIVQNALKLYSQDRTGHVDYALESGGGSVLSTRCSETYETKTALMSLFGVPLWYFSQSPRVVIQPDVYPGNCWAFKGSQGYLVIRLSLSVLPTAFCLEHIPKTLSPTGNISSAPRHFAVYGLNDEYQEEGKMLGRYTYQEDGESLQTFKVTEENNQAFQIIELRVLSNWGHPEYTCLYRFRVHGVPKTK